MNGSYQIIDSCGDEKVKIDIAEHRFAMTPEHHAIRHECHVHVFGQGSLILSSEEIMQLAEVLIPAMELMRKRNDAFYALDEVLSPA